MALPPHPNKYDAATGSVCRNWRKIIAYLLIDRLFDKAYDSISQLNDSAREDHVNVRAQRKSGD
jgi:hypothetical protein